MHPGRDAIMTPPIKMKNETSMSPTAAKCSDLELVPRHVGAAWKFRRTRACLDSAPFGEARFQR